MNPVKIQLSPEELLLVQNADLLLTKNRIIEKVHEMFGSLSLEVQNLFNSYSFLTPEISVVPPKISKGENYKGLPYLMLDYPRYFGKTDTFAIRTMFWWGHFFSTTLHLKGKYKDEFVPGLKEQLSDFAEHHFYLCINQDEWRHDFEADNYIPIRDATEEMVVDNLMIKEFCKISGKIALDQWDEVPVKLVTLYKVIIHQITVNFQGDGKGL